MTGTGAQPSNGAIVKPYAVRAQERRGRLQAALDALVARARQLPDVRAIYVHGSFATDRVGPHSDLDVVIVRETEATRWQRYEGLALGFDVPVAIDALVFTPEEFATLATRSSFGRTIARTMRPVYAA